MSYDDDDNDDDDDDDDDEKGFTLGHYNRLKAALRKEFQFSFFNCMSTIIMINKLLERAENVVCAWREPLDLREDFVRT